MEIGVYASSSLLTASEGLIMIVVYAVTLIASVFLAGVLVWERASDAVGIVPDRAIDPSRPAVIARCLDQIARATERISGIAREINLRNTRF